MHDTDNDGREVASVSFTVGGSGTEGPVTTSGGPHLSLDERGFAPGATIRVHFTAPADYPRNAWVGIIPATVPHGSETRNDQFDIAYQYLEKRTSGTLVFKAPMDPGNYDFRMHDTDDDGKEVAYVTFRVSP
jgi:hypothetical protein